MFNRAHWVNEPEVPRALEMTLSGLCITCVLLLASASTRAHDVEASPDVAVDTLLIAAPALDTAAVRVRVLRWHNDCRDAPCPVLYINDGQDLEAVRVVETLAAMRREDSISPLLVVAIDMPADRLGAYGVSDRTSARSVVVESSAGAIGAQAHAYARWMIDIVVPQIDARYRTQREPAARAVLGWSLGAAQAFDMAWQWPEVFGRVGALSPSFWLASDRRDNASRQQTRLAHARVHATVQRPLLRAYVAVGDAEETSDRDGDGVNDALDDARELIVGWRHGDQPQRGLRQLGYRIDLEPSACGTCADVAFDVVSGGVHAQPTWAAMLPGFLRWHFGICAPGGAARREI